MKRHLVLMLLALLALVSTTGFAVAAPAFSIVVQPDGSHVTVSTAGAAPATLCSDDADALRRCLADAAACDPDVVYPIPPPASPAPTFELLDSRDPQYAPTWLRRWLSDPDLALQCAAAGLPLSSAAFTITAAHIRPRRGIEPQSDLPNTFVWAGWNAATFARIWKSLAITTSNCQLNGSPCAASLANSKIISGTKLIAITYTGQAVQSGSVTFKVGAVDFDIPIQACPFSPKLSELTSLLAGADLQLLEVASSADCSARTLEARLRLRNGNVSLTATNVTHTLAGSILLRLQKIPEGVASGAWSLETDEGVKLGSVDLGVIAKPIAVRSTDGSPLLGIHYDVDGKLDLDQWHDGKSVAGRAVVTGALGEFFNYVQNTASLDVDPQLLGLSRRLAQPAWDPPNSTPGTEAPSCDTKPTTCSELDAKATDCDENDRMSELTQAESHAIDECHAWRRAWRVRLHSWQDSSWLMEDLWWRPRGEPAYADELGEITFAVFAPQPHPFQVSIELVSKDPNTGAERVVFQKYLTLANSAQAESLPLPLAQALYVECGHHDSGEAPFPPDPPNTDADADIISNGFTKAVNDEDVLTGGCRLHYSPRIVARSFGPMPRARAYDLLKYYGRQELTVTVRRGEATQNTSWSIDPTKQEELELPVPKDAKNAIGIYSVSAALRGPLPPSAIYRHASTSQTVENTTSALGDLEFHANLRPRGPFGWKAAPIRVFMTFPISFTGVRFPAKPSDLGKSSAFPNAQVTKIQAGALLALEPWNYDTGHNPWPVPTRFMMGMNFYNASDGNFAPSLLTGLSFTVPIIDLQKGVAEDQLGTDLALGLFWEADIGDRQWYRRGNHFLATLGVNLLSVFGSK